MIISRKFIYAVNVVFVACAVTIFFIPHVKSGHQQKNISAHPAYTIAGHPNVEAQPGRQPSESVYAGPFSSAGGHESKRLYRRTFFLGGNNLLSLGGLQEHFARKQAMISQVLGGNMMSSLMGGGSSSSTTQMTDLSSNKNMNTDSTTTSTMASTSCYTCAMSSQNRRQDIESTTAATSSLVDTEERSDQTNEFVSERRNEVVVVTSTSVVVFTSTCYATIDVTSILTRTAVVLRTVIASQVTTFVATATSYVMAPNPTVTVTKTEYIAKDPAVAAALPAMADPPQPAPAPAPAPAPPQPVQTDTSMFDSPSGGQPLGKDGLAMTPQQQQLEQQLFGANRPNALLADASIESQFKLKSMDEIDTQARLLGGGGEDPQILNGNNGIESTSFHNQSAAAAAAGGGMVPSGSTMVNSATDTTMPLKYPDQRNTMINQSQLPPLMLQNTPSSAASHKNSNILIEIAKPARLFLTTSGGWSKLAALLSFIIFRWFWSYAICLVL